MCGPRYRRLFPDVYAPADLPVDLALMSRAAAVLVEPDGVASGWSAAELLHASCGPEDAGAEVTLLSGRFRHPLPGLLIHRERLCDDEVTTAAGTPVTTPLRTAFDLVRWRNLTEGVAAVDALARCCGFAPAELRQVRSSHLGARRSRKLEQVLRLADPRSESPMESRIRVGLDSGGLPAPCVQHPVVAGCRSFRLDLAYPSVKLGVEYDGRLHRSQQRAMRDLEREALLAAEGWTIIRFDAITVLYHPRTMVTKIHRELRLRGMAW